MLVYVPPWWILGIAAVISAWWVTRVFGAGINTEVFVKIVQKLVRDKNISRAVKLTAAAGDAPVGTATRAALLASVSREEDNKRPATYRGSRPESMDSVKGRIRERYDAAFSTSTAPLTKSFYLAIVAPALLGFGAYLALTGFKLEWEVVGAAGVALVVWLYCGYSHLKILSARNAVFEALWPSFEYVYHERNTIDLDHKPASPLPTAQSPDETTSQAAQHGLTLEILEPGQPLRTVSPESTIIKIGTLETSHVQLSADGVARMHAVIEIADGKATIIDLGATRQTRVNLEPVNKQELVNGDVISIGEAELVVRLSDPERPPSSSSAE